MSRYTWLLDNGHGGMVSDKYLTHGKRSPSVPPGIYEGEFTRDIVKRLVGMCQRARIDCVDVAPVPDNVSLGARVRLANRIHRDRGPCIYLSIHANACGAGGWSSANGISTFHHRGSKTGKALAARLQGALIDRTGLMNRGTKRANFYVLRKTTMPAVLSENGFMSNPREARLLASDSYRKAIAKAHFDFIKGVEKEQYVSFQ